MQRNIFSPHLKSLDFDALSSFFRQVAQVAVVGGLVIVPLLYVPGLMASLGFIKTFTMVLLVYVAIVASALAMLRSGSLSLYLPLPLLFFWLFALLALASSALSPAMGKSVFGLTLEVQTSGFIVLLAVIMTVGQICAGAKGLLQRALLAFGVVAGLVQLWYLARLVFGPEWLAFGIFTTNTATLVGGLNDLALFSGLTLMMILIMISTIIRSLVERAAALLLTVLALGVLLVVNFAAVWWAVGFSALLTFLYLLSKDTWLATAEGPDREAPVSRFALGLVALICLVSGAFIVSGEALGTKVANVMGVNYLEVRPSAAATLEIMQAVYGTDAFLGVGPNRFANAWREHKDPAINETIFWNTEFTSGSGYVPTLFVTTGLVGGIVLGLFLVSLLYYGYRLVQAVRGTDPVWYEISLVLLVAVVYLWLMLSVYTPGPLVLLLAAGVTGLLLSVYTSLFARPLLRIDVTHNRQHGLLLIAFVLVIVVGATSAVLTVGKQFMAHVQFNEALAAFGSTGDVAAYDLALESIIDSHQHDRYLAERSQVRLAELNRLFALVEPTAEDEERFRLAFVEGSQLAAQAVTLDPENPFNHALRASFFGVLSPSAYEGIEAERTKAFADARRLDPRNPEYYALEAQIVNRFGNSATARTLLQSAVQLKSNYTDALFLLSQLEVQEGNTEAALATTRSIAAIEPNNPARFFQLGILATAAGDLEEAVMAYGRALQIDPNYANARYLLALIYADNGEIEAALAEMRIVAMTNSDNVDLANLIASLEAGEYTNPATDTTTLFNDAVGLTQQDEATVVNELPDTDLIAPLNRAPVPAAATPSTSEETPATASQPGVETVSTESIE